MITLYKSDYSTPFLFKARVGERIIPLHTAKILFEFFSKKEGTRIGGGDAVVVNIDAGLIKYYFKIPELDIIGMYQGKLVIDISQGVIRKSLAFDFRITE